MASISGSPAATRLPKAITRIASVTGQDSISERIIAAWLAELKSAHSALSPVRVTDTWLAPSRPRGRARPAAAVNIWFVPAAAPATTTAAVRPSAETDEPGAGGTTAETSLPARSIVSTPAMTARPTDRRRSVPSGQPRPPAARSSRGRRSPAR
jgi:hypothetical protein